MSLLTNEELLNHYLKLVKHVGRTGNGWVDRDDARKELLSRMESFEKSVLVIEPDVQPLIACDICRQRDVPKNHVTVVCDKHHVCIDDNLIALYREDIKDAIGKLQFIIDNIESAIKQQAAKKGTR